MLDIFTKFSCLSAATLSLAHLIDERAQSRVLLPFLRKVTTNITIIKKVVNLFERMSFVHFRMANQLNKKIGKEAYLF